MGGISVPPFSMSTNYTNSHKLLFKQRAKETERGFTQITQKKTQINVT